MKSAAPNPKKPTPTTLEKRNKTLRLELSNEVLERRLSSIKAMRGKYDAVEPNKNRRRPVVETKNEDQTLDARKRLLSHNIGRDLERNYAPARGIIHQFRINVVGSQGKIQINAPDGQQATQYFNEVWAKDCDFRDELHWSTVLQNVVAGAIREGDLLAVFDDEVTPFDTGKLILFESDQIANLKDTEFAKLDGYQKGWSQENGIVRDSYGRILGYLATGKRGCIVIDSIDDATFYPKEVARLVKNPWRLNQGRGVSAMLTAATSIQDLYEILSKELQSAKVAASMAGWTERVDAVTDFDDPALGAGFLPENSGKAEVTTGLEGANSGNPENPNYERFESLTGGIWEYVAKGDKINFADIDRPNVHLAEFIEAVMGHAGASVGLARAYTILRADSSYTSFRGDMILSWQTFYVLQKWLERDFADWVARKVVAYAVRKNLISQPQDGWQTAISFAWPTMPSVDEAKEENALRTALKNGSTDFSKVLGPNWRKKLEAYSEQIQAIRDMNLPLSVLETIGGRAEEKPADNQAGDEDE